MAGEINQPPVLSASEPFVDRYRRISDKWYPWMKKLFESLRTVQESFTTITETIDQVGQSWGVQINGANQVIGLVQLSANGGTATTFTVVADKFIVAHPTSTGATIQTFVAGLVGGVPTVGINGNLLVDGTILARTLSVNQLSEIAAHAGIIVSGRLQDSATSPSYYLDIAAGKFSSQDGSCYLDLKNKVLQFTTG